MSSRYLWMIAMLLLLPLGLAAQDETDQKPGLVATPADAQPQEVDTTAQSSATTSNPPLTLSDDLALQPKIQARDFLTLSVSGSESIVNGQTGVQGSNSGTGSLSRVFGTLGLERTWGVYDFNLGYVGSAFYGSRDTQGIGHVQQLAVEQKISGRRAQFQVMDSLSYSPQSNFGAPAFGGVGSFQSVMGGTLTGELNAGFNGCNPNFAGVGSSQRITNIALVEGAYAASRRTTLTTAGCYGLLHFLDNGGIGSHQYNVMLGYNYALNRRSTLAVLYAGAAYRFEGTSGSFDTQSVNAVYGYRPSDRLNMTLAAGPEVINGGSGVGNQLSWSGFGSIQYSLRRTQLRLRLERFINNGSGIFLGSQSNVARMDLDRSLSRSLDCGINFGFAHSTRLQSMPSKQSSNSVANLSYIGGRLARKLGETAGIFVTYQYDLQNSNSPICTPVSGCQGSTHQYELQIGFNWHPRPRRID